MKRCLILLGVMVCTMAALAILLPISGPLFIKKNRIETLRNPISIKEITEDRLIAQDGRILQLRFISKLPHTNAVFLAALARGVEVAPDGTLRGLIDVNHWCGNDPIGKHIARVNLSALAVLLGALPTNDLPESVRDWEKREFRRGIDPGHYGCIRIIEVAMEREPPTKGSSESVAAPRPPPAQP